MNSSGPVDRAGSRYSGRSVAETELGVLRRVAAEDPYRLIVTPISKSAHSSWANRLRGSRNVATSGVAGGFRVRRSAGSAPRERLELVARRRHGDHRPGTVVLGYATDPVDYARTQLDDLYTLSVSVASLETPSFRYQNLLGQRIQMGATDWHVMTTLDAMSDLQRRGPLSSGPAGSIIDRYLAGMTDLLLELLIDDGGRPDTHAELIRLRSDAMINERFADWALSPNRIAADLGISVRTLHRAHEEHDGVAQRLRRRRLSHAAFLLDDPKHFRTPISLVGRECGFASLATFARAFQAEYGIAPHRYRLGRAPGAAPLAVVDPSA